MPCQSSKKKKKVFIPKCLPIRFKHNFSIEFFCAGLSK